MVSEAVDTLMDDWKAITGKNDILKQSSENNKKGTLINLIANTQESKAIAAALLFFKKPHEAERMGDIPALVTQANTIPSLATLRDSAHLFDRLTFPKSNGIWMQPEVQQAIRYTCLWPWSRKKVMNQLQSERLSAAHHNTADRAALSYFLNILSQNDHARDTIYMLVTHDGPLIEDFIRFNTGIDKRRENYKPSPLSQKKKHIVYRQVDESQYVTRNLPLLAEDKKAFENIITGSEFVKFLGREQERIAKRYPMTHELRQAMDRLDDATRLLKITVDADIQAFGITRIGSFKARVRERINHSADAALPLPMPGEDKPAR